MRLLVVENDSKGILKQVLVEVEDPKSKLPVLKQMVGIMESNNGIGLTANQVGLLDRMFIFRLKTGKVEFAINPEIIKSSKRRAAMNEGCLSYPNKQVQVSRSVEIKVRYHNGHTTIIKTLKGMDARVFLHEFDHCEGECILGK